MIRRAPQTAASEWCQAASDFKNKYGLVIKNQAGMSLKSRMDYNRPLDQKYNIRSIDSSIDPNSGKVTGRILEPFGWNIGLNLNG